MVSNNIKYQGNRILLSHERTRRGEFKIYPSNHLLTYVIEGTLQIKINTQSKSFSKGSFVLLKKFTPAHITKTWDNSDEKFSSIVFTFQNLLIQDALSQIALPRLSTVTKDVELVEIAPNPLLVNFINSLFPIFRGKVEMKENIAKLKTLESLIAVIESDPALVHVFYDYTKPYKADLYNFMQHHFKENRPLKEFARDSARSLSTFKRDFRKLFNTSPAKWLKERRLSFAYHLLKNSNRKASDIYLEIGFEDLAHFSKSFKNQFGINPSKIN